MNLKQLNAIGSGAPFPIRLTKIVVEEDMPTPEPNVVAINFRGIGCSIRYQLEHTREWSEWITHGIVYVKAGDRMKLQSKPLEDTSTFVNWQIGLEGILYEPQLDQSWLTIPDIVNYTVICEYKDKGPQLPTEETWFHIKTTLCEVRFMLEGEDRWTEWAPGPVWVRKYPNPGEYVDFGIKIQSRPIGDSYFKHWDFQGKEIKPPYSNLDDKFYYVNLVPGRYTYISCIYGTESNTITCRYWTERGYISYQKDNENSPWSEKLTAPSQFKDLIFPEGTKVRFKWFPYEGDKKLYRFKRWMLFGLFGYDGNNNESEWIHSETTPWFDLYLADGNDYISIETRVDHWYDRYVDFRFIPQNCTISYLSLDYPDGEGEYSIEIDTDKIVPLPELNGKVNIRLRGTSVDGSLFNRWVIAGDVVDTDPIIDRTLVYDEKNQDANSIYCYFDDSIEGSMRIHEFPEDGSGGSIRYKINDGPWVEQKPGDNFIDVNGVNILTDKLTIESIPNPGYLNHGITLGREYIPHSRIITSDGPNRLRRWFASGEHITQFILDPDYDQIVVAEYDNEVRTYENIAGGYRNPGSSKRMLGSIRQTLPDIKSSTGTSKKELTSWRLIHGDIDLIRQNIISILTFSIGQRIRQEYFGSRIHESIEEPNNNVQSFIVKKFIKEAISTWEPRIKALDINLTREFDKLYIHIKFQINYDQSTGDVNVQLDL